MTLQLKKAAAPAPLRTTPATLLHYLLEGALAKWCFKFQDGKFVQPARLHAQTEPQKEPANGRLRSHRPLSLARLTTPSPARNAECPDSSSISIASVG